MSTALRIGARLTEPCELAGTWSTWSAAGDGPGTYFLVPSDEEAMRTNLKYAVVRAVTKRTSHVPELTLLRAHPPTKETR